MLPPAALADALRLRLAGTPAAGGTSPRAAPRAVVWVDHGDDVLVHLDALQVQIVGQNVLVALDLETDQTGRKTLVVPFALAGAGGDAGLVAVTDALPAGRASVRFRYRGPNAAPEERTVDPYRVIVRSGRYYLVGYDVKRRDWRLFALDAIVALPVKAGTVRTERQIPEAHGNADVLGSIKGTGRAVDVTVEFAPRVAASATSRIWRHDQRIEKLPGGRARLTVSVADPEEVVRWAFGFGADARVVSPPAAVRAAHDLARELLEAHDA